MSKINSLRVKEYSHVVLDYRVNGLESITNVSLLGRTLLDILYLTNENNYK